MKWEEALSTEYKSVRSTQIIALEGLGVQKTYHKNEKIEMERHQQILLINAGRVKISFISEKGHEKILYILSSGDLIGEIDFYSVVTQDYEIKAMIDTQVTVVSRGVFEKTITGNCALYKSVIRSVIRKYQIISTQLTDHLYMDSDGKIASVLLRLGEQEGVKVDGHVEYYYLKQQDIADLLGCSRVTVTRALNKFKEIGAIEVQNNKIAILNEEILKGFME